MSRSGLAAVALIVLAAMATFWVPASAAVGTSERRAAAYEVVARVSQTEVVAGEDSVKVTGRVRPRATGQTVLLQRRLEGTTKWKKSGTARIKRTGRFTLWHHPIVSGVRYYRVFKPASAHSRAGWSKPMRVTIYAWQYLAESGFTGPQSHVWAYLPSTVNGVAIPYSLEGYGSNYSPSFAEFVVAGRCLAFRAAYGLVDRSEVGASAEVAVSADGVELMRRALTAGPAQPVVTHIGGAQRLRIEFWTPATPKSIPTAGGASVACRP